MTEDNRNTDAPAGIEYHGVSGSSADCEGAVLRLLQSGMQIAKAWVLTAGRDHALLLLSDVEAAIAIKSGFASGYGGAGPTALSRVLQFLYSHGCEIEEVEVAETIIDQIDNACLTKADLAAVLEGRPKRPARWTDYIGRSDADAAIDHTLWRTMPPIMPYNLLDPRLVDLALMFANRPDDCLSNGYRRLEDIVRQRTGLTESGGKLFSSAFLGDSPPLTWKVADTGEVKGRANLFNAVFMAFRNPRAHREQNGSGDLAEFLLLNQLYRLEADAVPTPPAPA